MRRRTLPLLLLFLTFGSRSAFAACEQPHVTNLTVGPAAANGVRQIFIDYQFGDGSNGLQLDTTLTGCGTFWPMGAYASGQTSMGCTFPCNSSALYLISATASSGSWGCELKETKSILFTLPQESGSVSIHHYRNPQGQYRLFGDYTLPASGSASQLVVQQMPTYDESGALITPNPIFIPVSSPGGSFDIAFTPATGAHQFEVVATLTSCGTAARGVTIVECPTCSGQSGDPVWYADGTTRVTDGDPLPPHLDMVSLTRTYDTYHRFRGSFGRGWWSFFDARMTRTTSSIGDTIALTTETGDAAVFVYSNGTYTQLAPRAAVGGTLKYEGGSSPQYVYKPSGRLTALLYRASDGRFNGFRDVPTGREMQIGWNASGLPVSVTDTWTGLTWTIASDTTKRRITGIAVGSDSWSYEYDATDNLQRVAAPGNLTWRTYENVADRMTAVYDASGNLIESHTYNAAGAATSSTGPNDEIASIEYGIAGATGHDTITRVTARTGLVTDYLMHPVAGSYHPLQVTGGCSSCGANDATSVYDERGHATRQQDARGYVTRSEYDAATGALTQRETSLQPSGCDPATDANRCRMTSAQLAAAVLTATRGTQTTRYTYADPNWPERPTTIAAASIVSPGSDRLETFTYAISGEVLSHGVTGWNGTASTTRTTTTTLYDGVMTAAFTPGGTFDSQWLTLPQPQGRRKSIDGPRSDVTDVALFVYYPVHAAVPSSLRGRLAATKNAAGQVTRYEQYDLFGNPTRIVDPNGVASETTFDALGRLVMRTLKGVAGCNTTADPLCGTDLTATRTYSGAGPLLQETKAGGGVTRYEYDARGRVRTISRGPSATSLLERIESTYDTATGKKSLERVLAYVAGVWTEKKRESFAYDSFARLSTLTHSDATSVAYEYDAGNLMTGVRDENHTSSNTKYTYDPAGRLETVEQLQASGSVITRYAYNGHGNLNLVTDPNGNATSYAYDDFGQMTTQQSPITGTTTYEYDAAGNLQVSVDANGARTERSYDALNRPASATSTRGTAVETVTWTYDSSSGGFPVGRLSTMSDPTGSTSYSYDRRGLLLSELRSFNGAAYQYTTAFQYDRDGNRTRVSYPSSLLTVNYTYDYAGRPLSASGAVSSAEYLPFGPLAKLTFANGTTQTFAYDSRYRLSENSLSLPVGSLVDHQYSYDAAGNVTAIQDMLDHRYDRSFTYDELNRLTSATSAALWGVDTYSYDALGNMLSMRRGEIAPTDEGDPPGDPSARLKVDGLWNVFGRTTLFDYASTTSRLEMVTTNDLEHSVTYDAVGNETGYLVSRTYSPRNLLQDVIDDAEADDPLRHKVSYGYDGRGIRVVRAESPSSEGLGTARRYFLYSPKLRLLSVTRDDSANVWALSAADRDVNYEIVWFGDRPVAQVPTSGPAVYTFADHLGTPIVQTDANATITWQADYEPFGNIYSMRTGNRLDQPLRFPGQEVATTAEGTEENYNVFRWYRSGWGRYTQPDPDEITRLLQPYGYALQRPTMKTDPLGLSATAASPLWQACDVVLSKGLSVASAAGAMIVGFLLVPTETSTLADLETAYPGYHCSDCTKTKKEQCQDACVKAWEFRYDECSEKYHGNAYLQRKCYAKIAEILADCMAGCEESHGSVH